ncbi:MAG: ribbon-helix-helix domain-containing protein [Desulfurococcales archaeon]|jgi:metal-responsive CopG/Arc/MetJ family transcriptional regulator
MRLKIITFKIDEELLERIDLLAQETGTNRSDIIRKAIILYINKMEKESSIKKPRIKIIKDNE